MFDMSHRSIPAFRPLPPELPEAERVARLKRQSHAEWGLAVAALGGSLPTLHVLEELQRYIDGELSLAELARLPTAYPADAPVAEAVVRRHQLAEYHPPDAGASYAA
jgi:hypothetical protein